MASKTSTRAAANAPKLSDFLCFAVYSANRAFGKAYRPVVGHTITGTLTLSDQMFMMPRISAPTYPTSSTKCGT